VSSDLLPPALVALATILGCGVSGGQIVRCLHRKQSDDVSIFGWLAGAASGICLVTLCVITKSSPWLAFWEAAGVAECLFTALVAWRYRTPPTVATGGG
jgi:ABC-type enterobactin transport system permease subunit